MMAIAMIAAFVVNLLLGLPLFLCLLLTALVGFLFVDPALFANTLPQRFFGGMDIFSLMAIPLFVLAGNLMNHSGMTPRLMRLANALVGLWNSLRETVRLTASIYVIIAAASVVNWLLNYAQVASEFAQLLEPFGHSPTLMLFIISAVIFVCGMLMEEVSVLMLLTPIVAPVALAAGVDPVHLGLIFTLNITIALITPPMGACLFIVATISRLDILEMFKGIWPFILVALGVLSLLILFPSLTLWLPRLLN
ncbi:TPA: TRAP transporter large permease subunit [Pseudomonas aeruginosa]